VTYGEVKPRGRGRKILQLQRPSQRKRREESWFCSFALAFKEEVVCWNLEKKQKNWRRKKKSEAWRLKVKCLPLYRSLDGKDWSVLISSNGWNSAWGARKIKGWDSTPWAASLDECCVVNDPRRKKKREVDERGDVSL
jgi:hypothetical protein